MIGGLGAFGLPDFVTKYWSRLIESIAEKVVDKTLDKSLSRTRRQYQQDREDE
jgi:hypothetical protein